MSWNPHFERKKKRNRVSRGIPTRRRYFFLPILLLFLWVVAISLVPRLTAKVSLSNQQYNSLREAIEIQNLRLEQLQIRLEQLQKRVAYLQTYKYPTVTSIPPTCKTGESVTNELTGKSYRCLGHNVWMEL